MGCLRPLWTRVSSSRASLLLPPRHLLEYRIYSQARGTRLRGHCAPQAHSGIWAVMALIRLCLRWSVNAGFGWGEAGDEGIRIDLPIEEAVGYWAQGCTRWGQSSCGAAPSPTCLPPPLFYCTIHPAPQGWAGDSAAKSPQGRGGSRFIS